MLRNSLLSIGLLALACADVAARDQSDLLTRLVEASDHVLLADIIDHPSVGEDELDQLHYVLDCRIKSVYKGELKVLSIVAVNVRRHEMFPKKDRLKLLRKGGECVLFLRNAPRGTVPPLVSTDIWFAVQPATPTFLSVLEKYRDRAKQSKPDGKK